LKDKFRGYLSKQGNVFHGFLKKPFTAQLCGTANKKNLFTTQLCCTPQKCGNKCGQRNKKKDFFDDKCDQKSEPIRINEMIDNAHFNDRIVQRLPNTSQRDLDLANYRLEQTVKKYPKYNDWAVIIFRRYGRQLVVCLRRKGKRIVPKTLLTYHESHRVSAEQTRTDIVVDMTNR